MTVTVLRVLLKCLEFCNFSSFSFVYVFGVFFKFLEFSLRFLDCVTDFVTMFEV